MKKDEFDESFMSSIDELSGEERQLIFAELDAGIDEADLPDECTMEQYQKWLQDNGIRL